MDVFERDLNDLLTKTFNYILRFEEQSLRSLTTPVTVGEAHMLEAVGQSDGTTASEVAAALGFALPTVTVAMKRLESKGFVTRTPCDQDARRAIIRLTVKGSRVDRAHSLFHRAMVRNITSAYTEEERALLLTAVRRLSDFFRKKVEL